MKNIVIGSIGFIIIILLIVGFVKKQSEIVASSKQTITTQIARADSVLEQNMFGALVKNSEEAEILAQLGGTVQNIYINEGEKVKKGQILASISAPEISAQYTQANKGAQIIQEQEKKARRKWDDYKPEDREQFKLQAEKSRAARSEVGAMLNKLKIIAPFDGIIAKKYIAQGDTVMPGAQVMYIVGDLSDKEVLVDVSSFIGNSVTVGDAVKVFDDVDEVEGKIKAISPVSDKMSRKMMIKIGLNKNASFELGEFVNVIITSDEVLSGIKIPKEAVVNQYNDTFVFIVENGLVQIKSVEVIGELEGFAIVRGIDDGAEVAVSGAHDLQEGEAVIIANN